MLLLRTRISQYSIPVFWGSDFVYIVDSYWLLSNDMSMRIQYVIYIMKRNRIIACEVNYRGTRNI